LAAAAAAWRQHSRGGGSLAHTPETLNWELIVKFKRDN
jgi:hypothetical protein